MARLNERSGKTSKQSNMSIIKMSMFLGGSMLFGFIYLMFNFMGS